MTALLAIAWEPELRGVLIVIISVVTLMGSVYLILGTNMGARLGFLVAFAALAGWMFIMGAIWWTYGRGLLGPGPTWQPVAARTVIQDTRALSQTGVLDTIIVDDGSRSPEEIALEVDEELKAQNWDELDPSVPSFAQAGAAAGVFLEDSGAFAAGEYQVVNVFEIGGERSPQFLDGKIDFLAFFHKPHYALVEVARLLPQITEPGRAPARPVIDPTQPHQYVYMIRDLGAVRQPAGFITIGSLAVFLVLCYLLHNRDRQVLENTTTKAIPAAKV